MDPSLRELVTFEFGYCPHETWRTSFAGFPAIYVKDVRRIFDRGCLILRQAHCIAPTAKWFIVGGSPCQDLTYAGPFHGLLGLTGPHSLLFFPLQRTISLMQQLAGPEKVRYLAENAGSMDVIHFDAFCQLLNLDSSDPKKYLWDVLSFGAPIQRGRNFFRGHTDFEEVNLSTNYFPDGWGPIVDHAGKVTPLAPLLRTRCSGGLWDLSVLMDAVPTEGPNLALCILGRRCQVQCCFPIPCREDSAHQMGKDYPASLSGSVESFP